MSTVNLRAQLIAERDAKLAAADSARLYGDKATARRLVSEARAIIDELNAIDESRSWINESETQPKIDLNLSNKIMRR